MKQFFSLFTLVLLLVVSNANAQQWQQRETIPNWYAEPTLVFSLGNYGYWGSMLGDSALWRYDALNDSWQQMNNLPYPHGMMPFTINGVAYYMPVVNDQIFLYRYEEANDSWTEISQFPGTPRQGNFVFVIGNSAYMSCGRDFTGGHLQDHWEFNTVDYSWTQRADFIGYQRTLGGAFALNGMGYAGLGWTNSNFPDPYETDFYQYNPVTDTWVQRADLPISRGRFAVSGFSIDNRGYILGGEMANPVEWTAELLQYNDTTDSWTQMPLFPEGGQNFINTFVIGNSAFCGKNSLWEFNSSPESNSCSNLPTNLQQGLVGYWPFCGNANDESGNGNDGVVNGATLTEDRFGNVGSAVELNGMDQYISVSSDSVALLPSEEITLSAWFKIDADGAYSGNNLLGPLMRSRFYGYIVWYDSLSTSIQVITHHINNGEILGSDTRTPSGLNDNTWHLLTSTFNGSVSSLYLDGIPVDTFDISGNLYYVPDGIIAFGRDGNNPSPLTAHYAGKLDDIGIWNRALTAEEVEQLYGNFTQPNSGCTDPVALNYNALATISAGCIYSLANDTLQCGQITSPIGQTAEWGLSLSGPLDASILTTDWFTWSGTPGLVFSDNGQAQLVGDVVSVENPINGWHVIITLNNGTDWAGWSANGGGYMDSLGLNGENHTNWNYYILDSNNSQLLGFGDFEGDQLALSHEPSNYLYGFQFGIGANNRNLIDGGSGSFFYSGLINGETVSSIGSVTLQMNCETVVPGCTDLLACNYNSGATEDDGSCFYPGATCDDLNASTYNDIIDASCGCAGTPIEVGVEHTCGADFVHNPSLTYGSMTDQEGNIYKTIVIGDQEWMAENLNTGIYRNGESILTGLDDATWSTTNSGAWAYYNNDSINACPYGKLYNWYTCVDSRELCPTGWRVPNDSDWTTLTNHLGGETEAGGKMKSYGNYVDGTGLWFSPNAEATNSSGFSAVPGGFRSSISGFDYFTGDGKYWSLFEVSPSVARDYYLSYIAGGLYNEDFNKHYGLSVRCLRNTENTGLIPGCTDPLAFNYNPQATVNEGCEYIATIFVYNDLNGNGTHETEEPGLTNWPVLGNDINSLVWTNGNGNAFLPLEGGLYEFTVLNTTDNWVSTTPTSVTIDLTSGPATASFGLQVIPGEAIVAAGPFTGFWDILHCTEGYESGVYLENIGSQAVSGFMTLTCDPLFTPDADSYFTTPPVEVGPGYALWNVEDFQPGEYELLSFHIDGPGVEYLNQSFTFAFDLTLFDPQGNMIYSDNWSVSPIVACAYDPNDITGFPEGLSAPHEEGYTIEHYILPDNMVEFRVRFQNTGTLPAEDIDIYIPIDPNQWELSTIFPLMRSAEMQVICLHDDGSVDLNILEHDLPEGVTAEDLLIFSFDDINLPDSASDPEGSQGYVYFRMQAKHTLSIGDEINAQAFIYFEENPPIATNETYHVLFDCESFSPMVGDAELCAGDDLQFSASQPNVDEFAWSIATLEGSGNIFIFEGIDAGEYTLELNTSNMLCPQGEDHEVTIIVYDTPMLDLPLDVAVCAGEQVVYEAESDGDISWSNGASTGDVFTAEESFTVTATAVGAGGCSASEDWTITVNPLPSAEVDSANFVLTAADGVAWQWSVNGVLDATTQSINATENGNYQVEITNEFGCVVMSDVVAVELPIPDNVFMHSWSTLALFPNPMTTSARLELPQGAFDIALYDLTGACVRAMSKQQGTVLIERESLARGVYQVRISNGNDSRSIRLVIE